MSDVKAVFQFQMSKAGLEQELIHTGNRGTVSRSAEVPFVELSPEDRQFVLQCGRDIGSMIEVPMDRVSFKRATYKPEEAKSWIETTRVQLDTVPSVAEAIAMAREMFRQGETVRSLAQTRANAEQERLADLRRRDVSCYQELIVRFRELLQAKDLDGLLHFRYQDSTGHTLSNSGIKLTDKETEGLSSGVVGNIGHLVSGAINDLSREMYNQGKDRWIKANGSQRLRRAWDEGHDCQRGYVAERAALEAPGWAVDFDSGLETKTRSYPTTKALDALDKARSGAAAIGLLVGIEWITSIGQTDDEAWEDGFDEREGLVMRGYLPRVIGSGNGYNLYQFVE